MEKNLNEMPAYMFNDDGEVVDYKPGMKLSAFGQRPKISDDEKGVRGPLTILKYAIEQQDWEMVKQAADELESYVHGKYEEEEFTDDNQNLQEQISRIKGMMKVIQEQTSVQSIDYKKIISILSSLGFKNSPASGYKLHMDKPNNGPVKDSKGNYIPSYEAYIPSKQTSGFGYTDGKTPQLWIDKRSGLKPGLDEPNTYNSIFDLNPNGVILQNVKNGQVINKTTLTLDDFYNTLQSYK